MPLATRRKHFDLVPCWMVERVRTREAEERERREKER